MTRQLVSVEQLRGTWSLCRKLGLIVLNPFVSGAFLPPVPRLAWGTHLKNTPPKEPRTPWEDPPRSVASQFIFMLRRQDPRMGGAAVRRILHR